MKRLYLLRHAKAVATDPGLDDFARELTVRGMQDAAAMARYLHKNGMRPDLILASGAARTRQTAQLVQRELDTILEYHDTLYLAERGKILAMVQAAPAALSSVMVIGHNPGIEDLASLLAREPVRRKERQRRDVLEEKFPTAALAALEFNVDKWRDLTPGQASLVDFVRPKDL